MRRVTLGTLLLGVLGCRSMESVKGDETGGVSKVYTGKVEEMLKLSSLLLKKRGAESVERDGEGVFAHFPSNATHDGAYAGVWVKDMGDGIVSVRCLIKNSTAYMQGTTLTEQRFHEMLAKAVNQ